MGNMLVKIFLQDYTVVTMLSDGDIKKLTETLATKDDVSAVRKELKNDISAVRKELKNDISAVRKDLKDDISAVRKDLKDDISAVRKDLKDDVSAVRKDLEAFSTKAVGLFATKAEVQAVKEDTAALRELVQALVTSVDKLAKPIEDLRMEYVAVSSHLDRHEKWIKKIAEKVGITLDH